MTIRNSKLDELETKRDNVRAKIRELMGREDYYTDDKLYKKVAALTGLEVYLTYQIETAVKNIESMEIGDDHI